MRPRGRVALVGMPATVKLDLTTLWHRETELAGRLRLRHRDAGRRHRAGAPSTWPSSSSRDAELGRLVSATYPLADYTAAIEHAANAGRRGAVKIAFDLRAEKERPLTRPTQRHTTGDR